MKKIIDVIESRMSPFLSLEILPPLKGNSIYKVFDIIDKLKKFDPQFVNITSHHSEYIYKPLPNGTHRRVSVVKRPGTVAIAAAIQNRYGLIPVPHIICRGFTKEETEYALLDLNFLGINNLMLLRGDDKREFISDSDKENYHEHATDLQNQINLFNKGIGLEDIAIQGIETPFSYGMACYPEKHEEAPNMESDIHYLKMKVDNGADYLITQMFYDNDKYFRFVDRCRAEGINVPIIPGIKPIYRKQQLTVLPKVFRTDIPEALASQIRNAESDRDVKEIGIDWCIKQCEELIERGVPGIHFYTMGISDGVARIAEKIF
ncbi:MAG: methylenetetrahydrofolate reductase [NAD(P)H] [Muribaculaceae bacterium]|nr:methylenetetrahydrofolate reductase [NAD(P)H] [Muribaculaceae bacterium]